MSITDVRVQVPPRAPRRSKLHIACSDFFQKSERTHSAAPPLRPRFAPLDSRSVLGGDETKISRLKPPDKQNATTYVVAFCLGFGPAERASAPFDHGTAEVNSEWTPHLRRGPEGPYRKCSRYPSRSKLHIACSDFFQKSPPRYKAVTISRFVAGRRKNT